MLWRGIVRCVLIVIIDNYDSLVFNIARYFRKLGEATAVVRNYEVGITDLLGLKVVFARLPFRYSQIRSWQIIFVIGPQSLHESYGPRLRSKACDPIASFRYDWYQCIERNFGFLRLVANEFDSIAQTETKCAGPGHTFRDEPQPGL
ncbi:hypothetical protein ACVW1C_005889 [Bradyrhizobium sp. USDA 4011]